MAILSSLAAILSSMLTFIQVLFYLPLALDIAGLDAFLALSASLASYYFFLSTVQLLTRRTRLAWIGRTLAVFQFVVVPACLLVCCNVYSPPSTTIFPPRQSELDANERATRTAVGAIIHSVRGKADGAGLDSDEATTGSETLDSLIRASATVFFYLARHLPAFWHKLLTFSSPFFSLLEGVASLLVIQSLASTSRWIIASSLVTSSTRYQTKGPASASAANAPPRRRWFSDAWLFRSLSSLGFGASEVWQIFFLLISATTYVCAALALYVSFDGATKDRPGTAAAIATSVTSTVWLTVIAFAIRKGNVIETSLMFAYVVFNVYQLGPSLSFTPDPISLIRSLKVNTHGAAFAKWLPLSLQAPLPSKILQALWTLLEVLAHWLGQSVDFLNAAGAALPKSVIVSLIYRLTVLYAASRILPMLKGSVAASSQRSDGESPPHGTWGKTRGDSIRASTAGHKQQDGEESSDAEGAGRRGRRGNESSSETESGTSTDSNESEAVVEEYEEEVWDEDEGRWILQKRRRTIRRRRRSRSRYTEDYISEESDSLAERSTAESEDGEDVYSEDDSGIAYQEDDSSTKRKATTRRQQKRAATAANSVAIEPLPLVAETLADRLRLTQESASLPNRLGGPGSTRREGKPTRTSAGRRSDARTSSLPRSATGSGVRDRSLPSDLDIGSIRPGKRRRDASGSSTSSSSSSTNRRSSKRRHRSSPSSSVFGQEEIEAEPMGAFISILVSYSRLILIAVYSHLLLLDQKNQIYCFLTVGVTLTLWGLELVISKEDEVDLGGGGGMLAR
ncbi:hypothetical protein ACQY0O_000351 [Thecaphora frezii]